MYTVKQLNPSSTKITQSIVLPPSQSSRTRMLSHWAACARYLLLTVSSFKSLPAKPTYLTPTVLERTFTD